VNAIVVQQVSEILHTVYLFVGFWSLAVCFLRRSFFFQQLQRPKAKTQGQKKYPALKQRGTSVSSEVVGIVLGRIRAV